jgi:hypothetical protein
MLRLSQNLLLGLLFLLQGITPLVHAHFGGPGIPQGIHVDGLSEALIGAGDNQTNTRAREDESPGIGVGTPKRNDDRATLKFDAAPALRTQPAESTTPRLAPSLRATEVAYVPPDLRPAPRAPPRSRLS